MLDQVEIVRAACCIASIDGQVSEAEETLLRQLAQQVGVGQMSLKAMMDRAKSDPNFYEKQFQYLHADPDVAMKALFRVAVCDGDMNANERVMLQFFADRLGVDDQRFEQYLAAAEKAAQQVRNKTA
jgi:tellurite resistance protein